MSDDHPSPLRYPGGKQFLTTFLTETIRLNNLQNGIYVEPCAGGAGAALRLLFNEEIYKIHLNDLDPCIFAFWKSILDHTDDFLELLAKTPVDVRSWRKQRAIYECSKEHSTLELGFATFFLNRCNRSGALNAGPIGGLDQKGNYPIDARFNRTGLKRRIERIRLYKDRITVSCMDAVRLLAQAEKKKLWPHDNTIVYLDPPYYVKGKGLYRKFFTEKDHSRLASFLNAGRHFRWIISYDDESAIRSLYSGEKNVIFMNYFMHTVRIGRELVIASSNCKLPKTHFVCAETEAKLVAVG